MGTLSQVIDDEPMLKITSEFRRLGDKCYLENAGATLFPQSLLASVNDDLTRNVYMNPHSDKYTKDCIEQIRSMILRHFNTDPSNYTVVFTSGTTQSLKLTVEAFRFSSESEDIQQNGSFVYLRYNHTSVLGLREIAREKKADVVHISHEDFLSAITSNDVKAVSWKDKFRRKSEGNTLLVYPGQSNFNGYKYPLDCIDSLKNGCLNKHIKKNLCLINHNWYVLLDAASYVSTSRLDLYKTQPDFVCLSFYKIFGYPTGLGALLVKNSSQDVLTQKKYYGGGTVDFVLTSESLHMKRKSFHESFEDGTVSYLSIIALKHCFDTMHKLIPKTIHDNLMDTISFHTFSLAKDLYHQLKELKHSNGRKAAVLYMDSDFTDIRKQGGIVTFNLLREDGTFIGYSAFQHMADLFNISIRTGCFCNSGSCQKHLVATDKEMKETYKAGHVCGDEIDLINGKPTGAIRASFGYFNTFRDTDKLLKMICQSFVKATICQNRQTSNRLKQKLNLQKTLSHLYHNLNDDDDDLQNIPVHKLSNIQTKPDHIHNIIRDIDDSIDIYNSHAKIIVRKLAIFPIKSCGAFKINSSWSIGPKGFDYDREWMIIKDNGVCLTQKNNTKMCLICPKIDLIQRTLTLHFKDKTPITIPLDHSSRLRETSFCQTRVCTDAILGHDCGDAVGDWISEALEISYLRLIRQSYSDTRIQKKKVDGEQNLLSLSNQAQFLLINKATVRWLRDKIIDLLFDDDIDTLTDRFRGNIIIDMENELAEREWQRVIIGNQEFKVDGQCNRCSMVCINQKTGEKTVEPLRTISEIFKGKMRFGIYLTYVGPVDGSQNRTLKILSPVKPIFNVEEITR